jgi:mannitol/fructose-specific phosphotransferase system IIA component (Ntr-type)
MSLSDLFISTAILEDNRSLDKKEVIHQLLLQLAVDGHLDQASVPSVLDGVMRRESLCSTAVGGGIAVPHTKHPAINRRLGILGLCRHPGDKH